MMGTVTDGSTLEQDLLGFMKDIRIVHSAQQVLEPTATGMTSRARVEDEQVVATLAPVRIGRNLECVQQVVVELDDLADDDPQVLQPVSHPRAGPVLQGPDVQCGPVERGTLGPHHLPVVLFALQVLRIPVLAQGCVERQPRQGC